MTNFEFLKNYQALQSGIMYDKLVDLGFASLAYCRDDNSAFWNHVLVNRVISVKKIVITEKEFKKLGRAPVFYFENKKELQPLIEILKEKGYRKSFEDSWMFYDEKKESKSNFGFVKKVSSEEELKLFLKIFNACYQKDDPQNAYGELGDYLFSAKKVWLKHKLTGRLEYFLIYKGLKPVAVSSLTNYNGIGYISNVGSLREVRGQGFGKLATLYCVSESLRNGNQYHCLATEEGTYANEFYKRIGFKTLFIAIGYAAQI